jgi:hypothetical protein
MLSRIPKDTKSRALFAELLSGNIYHHFLYVGKKATSGPVDIMNDDNELKRAVVVAHMFDPVELSNSLSQWNMNFLPWKHRNLAFRLPIPRQSRRVLALIDGSRNLEEIYTALLLNEDDGFSVEETFQDFVRGSFRTLYKSLNGINKLYLTWTHTPIQKLVALDHRAEIISNYLPMHSYHAPAKCG